MRGFLLQLLLLLPAIVAAFAPARLGRPLSSRPQLFRRNQQEESTEETSNKSGIPFFGRLMRQNDEKKEIVAPVASEDEPPPSAAAVTTVVVEEPTPLQQAQALRAQAEKARLEAERLDAELTLQKIGRLEKELAHAQAKGEATEDVQREMELLRAKMRGEAPREQPQTVSNASSVTTVNDGPARYQSAKGLPVDPYDPAKVEERRKEFEQSPDFLKKSILAMIGMEFSENLNTTEVAVQLDKMRRMDFSPRPRPTFTLEEVRETEQRISSGWTQSLLDSRLTNAAGGNTTELALLVLEFDHYSSQDMALLEGQMEDIITMVDGLGQALNMSTYDVAIEAMYPKCTRKDQQPTEAQVQQFIADILPKTKFSTSSKPIPVAGGFLIQGASRASNGDELIESIEGALEKSSLGDKMTVTLTNDFTVFAGEDDDFDPTSVMGAEDPLLYIMGPDVVREPKPVLLSITSALGLATTWYLSLYPFLLNSGIAQRVDEELALADANMNPDLAWLTDLSVPLFTTYVAIQLFHEAAHRIVAAFYGVKLSVPTWVPSIITGITSSVTSFKSLPNNKNAMFDVSVAGPLAGMIASLSAIGLGSQLTVTSDMSLFPALPLEILRQSTLGGGIIENVLGSGALSIPEGAIGSMAVASMTIPLHPVAVAGYIGLVVNALCLLPIGTTDGGRMALALFGRGPRLLIGNLFLLATLAAGIAGSDLFLFYFAFCIAFQTGNEVPAKNEFDPPAFSRVVVATTAYVLATLSLIPFQS